MLEEEQAKQTQDSAAIARLKEQMEAANAQLEEQVRRALLVVVRAWVWLLLPALRLQQSHFFRCPLAMAP